MTRLRLAWMTSWLLAAGCSDDGTAGTGETGAGTGTTSGSGTDSASATSPTSPTGSATTSDPTDATTSTGNPDSDSTSLDSSASSTSDDPSSGTGSGTGTGSGSDSSGGSTGGEPEFMACLPDGGQPCPEGLECYASSCCFGLGFCVPPNRPFCGGMLGPDCEDDEVCVTDLCVAGGTGVCVSSSFFDDACVEQSNCWNECTPD